MRHPFFGDDPWFGWDDPYRRTRREERRPYRVPVQQDDVMPAREATDDPAARRRPEPVHPADRPAPAPAPVEPARATEPAAAPAEPGGALHKDDLRDALRELQSAKQRVERDAERVKDDTRRKLIEDLLPVLDNLERSIAAGAASADPALRQGVQLVRDQFERVLAGYGLERLDSVGAPFDPNVHDAVAVVEVDEPSQHDLVVDEWAPGYRLGDRVLRPAKVRVGKQRAAAAPAL